MARHTNIPLLTLPGLREKVTQIVADGGSIQNTANCIYNPLQKILQYSPSMVFAPYALKTEKLYGLLGTDFSVTRSLDTATRVDSSGLIASVASGVPRIDWLGQSCPGLLVEASAQNLALQSTFSTGWSTSFSGSVSGNASGTNSPEGSGNAALLSVVATTFSSIWRTITTVSGSVYTASVFAKKRDKDFLYFVNLAGSTAVAWFNLASGTVGTVGANTTARIENYGNGWYRCSITQTAGGTTSYIQFGLSDANNTNAAASSGSNFVFGAQFELGSVPTSYIPTTAEAVSRAADVISASGALVSGLIGQTEGTIYVEVDFRNLQAGRFLSINAGTTANRILLVRSASNVVTFTVTVSSSNQYSVNSSVLASGVHKFAAAYKQNDFAFYVDGSLVGTSNSGNVPACTQIDLGNETGSFNYQDRIRAAALYTTRLSNDQLAELTRL